MFALCVWGWCACDSFGVHFGNCCVHVCVLLLMFKLLIYMLAGFSCFSSLYFIGLLDTRAVACYCEVFALFPRIVWNGISSIFCLCTKTFFFKAIC